MLLRGMLLCSASLDIDSEWTRELYAQAQKFWQRRYPSFDDDFRGLSITLRKRKLARIQERIEQHKQQQQEFLTRLKTSTYTRVWNTCMDVSFSRGKLRPAFDTWKEVTQAMNTLAAANIAQEDVDIYAKILADTEAVAHVDEAVLANLCKINHLAYMQGRVHCTGVGRALVCGIYETLKQEAEKVSSTHAQA